MYEIIEAIAGIAFVVIAAVAIIQAIRKKKK